VRGTQKFSLTLAAIAVGGALLSLLALLVTGERSSQDPKGGRKPEVSSKETRNITKEAWVNNPEPEASRGSSPIVTSMPPPLVEPEPPPEIPNDPEAFHASVFDKIPDERFDGLDPIQQAAFANSEEKFNTFYREWVASGKTNPEEWNEKVKEFHQQMLLELGPDQMDKLLSPPTPGDRSP
jgi:hypothetical protein